MTKDNVEKVLKKILYTIITILLIVLLMFFSKVILDKKKNEKNFENSIISFNEKNKEKIFSINKLVFFVGCNAKNKNGSQTNFTIENLYTYADIALFLDNNSNEDLLENTLKNVKITNIKFNKKSSLGNSDLYYKNVNDFAKSEINDKNKIENELKFEVTDKNEANLSNPILYNNLANPITLSYINQNIKTDYTMLDIENPITYDGRLLKKCGISIASINASVSFDIEIENNKNQKFKTTVYFDIPYEYEEQSIYDGKIIITKNVDFNFYRYE